MYTSIHSTMGVALYIGSCLQYDVCVIVTLFTNSILTSTVWLLGVVDINLRKI